MTVAKNLVVRLAKKKYLHGRECEAKSDAEYVCSKNEGVGRSSVSLE